MMDWLIMSYQRLAHASWTSLVLVALLVLACAMTGALIALVWVQALT